jgi:REP element-mobilizing transposase RayT
MGMPRKARIELAGGIHHVTMGGNRKQEIFRDDRDRSAFLREFEVTSRWAGWRWLSYCLMSNHAHLMIETPQATLAQGMHRFASWYAQAFNRKHGTRGHLFQGRYWNGLVDSDVYLGQALRYIAFNPVKARLCSDPVDWPWSSHRSMLAGDLRASIARERVETLLACWGGLHGTRYASLFDPDEVLARRLAAPGPWTPRPPLNELLASDGGLQIAREHGYGVAEIAAALGVSKSTVSRRLRNPGR